MNLVVVFVVFSFCFLASADKHEDFLQCLSIYHPEESSSISQVIYTPNDPSYQSVLQFSIRNLRFNTSATPKPLVIVTPTNSSHIQASVICSKKHGLQVRVRSGGHDFEGLSYVASNRFIVLDLIKLRNFNVDVASKSAWVQSGATLGELYYGIAQKSKTLAFPAGTCPTVGVGGFLSGGGYGSMFRNFGLGADNVLDAILIDASGKILDRASMGEDLFWAIRGGGGNTYGIVVAWKINLVEVPRIVTVSNIQRALEQGAFGLVNEWQDIAHNLPHELDVTVQLTRVNTTEGGNTTLVAVFTCLYLGRADKFLSLMQEKFPELGVVKEDSIEMSWIESIVSIAGFTNYTNLDQLLNRTSNPLVAFKAKHDFVRKPVPEAGLEGLFRWLNKINAGDAAIVFIPYGGKMSEISDTSLPFPHRAGNIYKLLFLVDLTRDPKSHLNWIRGAYNYVTPYVSKNPRAAYVNYRDLDIGTNDKEYSYLRARIWGVKYFGKNFDRLVRIKTKADPTNFFRNEQSVPPLRRR